MLFIYAFLSRKVMIAFNFYESPRTIVSDKTFFFFTDTNYLRKCHLHHVWPKHE